MRVMYNWNEMFRDVPKNKHSEYYDRIFSFIQDVAKEKTISNQIINKYNVKKMRGTKGIFKFYASVTDGSRCLIKYFDDDNQIFENEPGIAILRVVRHDEQGEVARRLESVYSNYQGFLLYDEDEEGNDENIEQVISEQYLKTVYINDSYTNADIEKILSDDDSKTIYPLSKKQINALHADLPTMILGCAGSGKTMLQVAKALKNAHSDVTQAYFTFTSSLKENSELMYKKYSHIPSIIGKTSFFAITDFFLQALQIPKTNFVDYERFVRFFTTNKYASKFKYLSDIPTMELWIEIKGIIKGYLGDSFYRNRDIKLVGDLRKHESFQYLINERIIQLHPKSGTYIIQNPSQLYECTNRWPFLKEFMFNQDFSQALLNDHSYLEVNESYSRFSKPQRENIYQFVKKHYQPYLEANHLYDSNDLARLYIYKQHQNEFPKFDFAYLDEIQDLSEMQIFSLMQSTKLPGRLYMTGDISQIINPTFFKGGRPGVLIRNRLTQNWTKDNIIKLDENYRNSEQIVNVANRLLAIRKNRLGSYSEYIFEEPKKIEKVTGLPAMINVNKNTMLEALTTWLDAPKVAIIACDEESKKALIKDLGLDIKKEGSNLFTVQEIKGLEFEKVILYNILSDYKDAWVEIMSHEVKQKQEYFQFYFNLFYVALTRAKKNIYIYEAATQLEIINQMVDCLEPISKDVLSILDISDYQTNEAALEQAEIYFKNEEYKRARIYYLRLKMQDKATLCIGYSKLKSGEFSTALEILYLFPQEYLKIFDFADYKTNLLFHILIGHKTGLLSLPEIIQLIQGQSIIDLVEKYKNKPIYSKVFFDSVDLMQLVKKHQINKELEHYYG